MSTHRHDWDLDEREALTGLEDQIEAIRSRHKSDPPFDLLRAAHGDALPPDLQDTISEHMSGSPFSRTLAEGLGEDEPSLSAEQQERLLARIMKQAATAPVSARRWQWLRPVMIGAGAVALASLVWFVAGRSEVAQRSAPPESVVVVAEPPPIPAFLLPLDKPDIKIGMAALTWRGATTADNQLLSDLKPGLDAYRNGDYAAANRELTALASRYPKTVEIVFYQGISRLFLNDLSGAIASLSTAEAIGDPAFASDVMWYRAVAEQRAGNVMEARTRLDALCRANGDGATRACEALKQLPSNPAAPR